MRILCSTVLLLALAAPQVTAWLPSDITSSGSWRQSPSISCSSAGRGRTTAGTRSSVTGGTGTGTDTVPGTPAIFVISRRRTISRRHSTPLSSARSSSTNPNTLENRDSSNSNNNNNSSHNRGNKKKESPKKKNNNSNNINNRNIDNILEDGAGHVNRDLAENIWEWEQQRRERKSNSNSNSSSQRNNKHRLPPKQVPAYSVRAAMRLVDSLVEEAVRKHTQQSASASASSNGSNGSSNNNRNSEQELYADLIQEGLSALLDVMSQYDDTATAATDTADGTADNTVAVVGVSSHNEHHINTVATAAAASSATDFEATARRHIRSRLADSLEQDVRPVRLPVAVKAVVEQAKACRKSMYEASGTGGDGIGDGGGGIGGDGRTGRKQPTLSQVAEEMNIPVDRLEEYLRLARKQSTLSMESTVEISNPAEDVAPSFADQDEWELQHGMLLDNGKTVQRDKFVEEYKDKMLELEGDDEAWVLQERNAGPLQELIPDNEEPTPDDLALSEMIRHDMSEFLTSTLDPQEVQVVRLSFGLDSGNPLSVSQTAKAISITKPEAAKLLQRGLEKLRASYTSRYVESYLDEDEEPYDFVDSV